jgi:hypothetical protein
VRRAAAALVVAAALVAGGCSGDDGDSQPAAGAPSTTPTTAASTTTTAAGPLVPVVDLGVGDCFDEGEVRSDEPSLLQQVHAVDCDEPHRNEVYAVVPYDEGGDGYPGNGPLAEFAQDRCVSAFEDALGTTADRTPYGIGTVYPDEESWATGDRAVVCVLFDAGDAPLEGPVATLP